MADTNQFLYRIGADTGDLDRAVSAGVQSLDRMDAAARELSLRLAALSNAGAGFAGGQRESATAAERFAASLDRQLNALRAQSAALGKSEADLLRLKAAELGVAQQSEQRIRDIERLQQAQAQQAQAAQQQAAGQRAVANILAAAQNSERQAAQAKREFIQQLEREVVALGRTREELLRVKAAQVGAAREAGPLIAQLEAISRAKAGAAAGGGLSAIGGTLRGAGALLGVGVGVGAIKQTTDSLIEAQVQLERLRLQFTAGFGAEKAGRELEFVRKTANEFGLQIDSVAGQYAKFAASTRGTSLEGQVTREIFLGVAESAAVLGLNVEETEGILRAFGQIASKGRVQLEELSGQLGDRLVGALDKAARAMGKTREELLALVQSGGLSATEFLPNLARILREDVAESAEGAANRLDAVNKRLGNSFANLKQQLSQGFFADAVRATAESLTSDFNALADALERNRNSANTNLFTELVRSGVIQSLGFKVKDANKSLDELRGKLKAEGGNSPAIQAAIAQTEALIGRLNEAITKQKIAGGAATAGGNPTAAPVDSAAEERMRKIREEEEKANRRRGELAKVTADLTGENDKYVKQLGVLQASLLAGDFKGKEEEYRSLVNALIQQNKPKKETGGGEVDQVLKKRLQSRLRNIEITLDQERAAFDFNQAALQGSFDDGLIDIDAFYSERTAITQKGVAAQVKALDDEAQAYQEAFRNAKGQATRVDAEERYKEAIRRRSEVQVQASRDAALAAREEAKARAALDRQFQESSERYLELRGQELQAEGLRNQRQVADFERLNKQVGGDPANVDAFRAALENQRQLNELRRASSRLSEEARDAEEAYLLAAERGGLSLQEVERGVLALRQKSLQQLEALAARARQLAGADAENPELERAARQLEISVERARQTIDPAFERIKRGAEDAGQSIAASLGEVLLNGGKGWRDSLRQLDRELTNIILRTATLEPLARNLGTAFKSVAGGGNIFDAFKNAFGFGGGAAGVGAAGAAASGILPGEHDLDAILKAIGFGGGGAAGGAAQAGAAATASASLTALASAATAATAALGGIAASGGGNAAVTAAASAGGSGGDFFSSVAGWFTGLFAANGHAFDGGRVQAFASGGIVDRPTFFSHRGGMGVAGEAGTEGVLPLKRTSSGRLGVEVAGRAARPARVANLYYQAAPGDSRPTSLQRAKDMQRELQKSFR